MSANVAVAISTTPPLASLFNRSRRTEAGPFRKLPAFAAPVDELEHGHGEGVVVVACHHVMRLGDSDEFGCRKNFLELSGVLFRHHVALAAADQHDGLLDTRHGGIKTCLAFRR